MKYYYDFVYSYKELKLICVVVLIFSSDVPLSYGLVDFNLESSKVHQADFIWDPMKETGLYFKVNAISTEFTAKKHGGEKGVPFRIQVETYTHGDGESKLLHAASCQIKVFKVSIDRKSLLPYIRLQYENNLFSSPDGIRGAVCHRLRAHGG